MPSIDKRIIKGKKHYSQCEQVSTLQYCISLSKFAAHTKIIDLLQKAVVGARLCRHKSSWTNIRNIL